MTGSARPDADNSGLLEQLGFSTPPTPSAAPQPQQALPPHARMPIEAPAATPSAAAPSSRREARELAARPTAKSSKSAERRIRAVQRSYGKPKRGRSGTGVVVVPSGSTRPPAARTKTTSRARGIGSRVLSVAAMVFAGALAVGMSVPANAFDTGADAADQLLSGATAADTAAGREGQSIEVSATATTGSAARDAFTVTSWAEMLRLKYGSRDYTYELGDPNGPIRWPFPYAVPVSSGYGERAAPCYGCSTIHMGIDFNPGAGAPIYSIADGVIKQAEDGNGGYGNFLYIDHGNLLGDGVNVVSLYAHMQHGSSTLKVGDTVRVGDFLGTVGSTGQATGPHLHFELLLDSVQVDGFAWLRANA